MFLYILETEGHRACATYDVNGKKSGWSEAENTHETIIIKMAETICSGTQDKVLRIYQTGQAGREYCTVFMVVEECL